MRCTDSLYPFLCRADLGDHQLLFAVLLWLVLLLVAILVPGIWGKWPSRIGKLMLAVANRRWLAISVCGLLMVVIRVTALPLFPIPEPSIHDEFSYFLLSDTFASGRLTNPTHPMAVHFETFHVNQWPTYQSMYLPAKGIFLAIGQVTFGHPWYGLLLAWALAVAATVWMLQGWMAPKWALLGGLFWVGRFSFFEQVMMRPGFQTYMETPEVILGGALIFGAAGRLRKRLSPGSSAALGIGLALLATSRPMEGFVVSAVVVLAVIIWVLKQKRTAREVIRGVIPGVLIITAAIAGLLYYNWRGTGHALVMPYQLNWEQYHITRPFLWQSKRALPHYNHPSMRAMYVNWEFPPYLNTRFVAGLREHLIVQIRHYWMYWVFPLTPLLLIGIWESFKKRYFRIFSTAICLLLIVLLCMTWPAQFLYASAGAAAALAMMVMGLRIVRTWTLSGKRFGRALAQNTVLVVAILCMYRSGLALYDGLGVIHLGWSPFSIEHRRVEAELENKPGKHLLIVYYPILANPSQEWVYNRANVDQQRVVWARNMGVKANQELLDYYHDRDVWVINPKQYPVVLHPYKDVKDKLDGKHGFFRPLPPESMIGAAPSEEIEALRHQFGEEDNLQSASVESQLPSEIKHEPEAHSRRSSGKRVRPSKVAEVTVKK
jgi:hypothetical protein